MITDDRKLFHKTKAEALTELLREKILRQEIVPGEWLRQEDLAREFDISHSPIREALRNLENVGLVEHVPHKGVRVVDFTVEDVEEFYLLRSLLECFAVREAIARLDDEALENLTKLEDQMVTDLAASDVNHLTEVNHNWHLTIVAAAGRPRLLEMTKRLWAAFPWDNLWAVPGRAKQSVCDHQEIMEAIRQRDANAAEQLMKEHLMQAATSLIAHIRNGGSGIHYSE